MGLLMIILGFTGATAIAQDQLSPEVCKKMDRFIELHSPDSKISKSFGCAPRSADITMDQVVNLLLSCNQKKGGQNSSKALSPDQVPQTKFGNSTFKTTTDCRGYELCTELTDLEGKKETFCHYFPENAQLSVVRTQEGFCGVDGEKFARERAKRGLGTELSDLKLQNKSFAPGVVIPAVERDQPADLGQAWLVYQQACFTEEAFWDKEIMAKGTLKPLKKSAERQGVSLCKASINSFWSLANTKLTGNCKDYLAKKAADEAIIRAKLTGKAPTPELEELKQSQQKSKEKLVQDQISVPSPAPQPDAANKGH
jgi:hypothetical protein